MGLLFLPPRPSVRPSLPPTVLNTVGTLSSKSLTDCDYD